MAEATAPAGGEVVKAQGEGDAPAEPAPKPKAKPIKPIKNAEDAAERFSEIVGGQPPAKQRGSQALRNEFGVIDGNDIGDARDGEKIHPPKEAKRDEPEGGEKQPKASEKAPAPQKGEKDAKPPAPQAPEGDLLTWEDYVAGLEKDGEGNFTFAGKKFKSAADAEHAVKTVLGMHKAAAARDAESKKAVEDASAKARGWYNAHQVQEAQLRDLQARLQQFESGGGQARPPAAAQPADPRGAIPTGGNPTGEFDFSDAELEEHARLAAEDPRAALRQFGRRIHERTVSAAVEQARASVLSEVEPFISEAKRQRDIQDTTALFAEARDAKDPVGNALLPELGNEEEASAVAQIWFDMGARRDKASILAAAGVYRIKRDAMERMSASQQAAREAAIDAIPEPAPPPPPAPSDQGSPVIVDGHTQPAREAGSNSAPFDFMKKRPSRNEAARLRAEFGVV